MPSCSPEHLQHSVAEYVQGVCACIEAAKDAQAVESLLQQAKGLLFPADSSQRDPVPAVQQAAAASSTTPAGLPQADASSARPTAPVDAAEPVDAAYSLACHAVAVQQYAACFGEPGAAAWRAFCGAPFSAFAGSLLSVVAPDWLPQMAAPQQEALFDAWFLRVPASAALLALTSHLALVQTLNGDDYGSGPTVSAIGADSAARLLAARFAQADSQGIKQLVGEIALAGAGFDEQPLESHSPSAPGPGISGGTGAGADPPLWGFDQGLDLDLDAEEIAAALTSVPERAAATRLPALRPPAFVALLVKHLLQAQSQTTQLRFGNAGGESEAAADLYVDSQPSGVSGALGDSGEEAGPSGPRAEAGPSRRWYGVNSGEYEQTRVHDFVGLVLSKLARRGHARLAARALWRSIRQHVAVRPAAGGGGGAVAGSEGEYPAPAFGVPGSLGPAGIGLAGVTDPAAAEKLTEALLLEMVAARAGDAEGEAVLGALFGGAAWARSDVRFLLGDKLFTQRTLPLPALRWLIGFLSYPAGQAAPVAWGGQESVPLAGVTLRLAQGWGDASAVTATPVKQQACLTAALVEAVKQLGKGPIEQYPGLLPALLSGVSVRLESPLPPVRLQGMRVGAAFSAALDPTRPPLFNDVNGMALMPEEVWHRSALGEATHTKESQDAAAAAAAAAGTQVAAAEGGVETGTDSDDDSLEPYDLSEGDDEEVGMKAGRQPMQLRDVAAALRKQDDVSGVLAALKLVDGLIEAAPDELDHYAEELGRSLLHTRVPEWAEVEAHEAKPTDQRFRAMVTLLAAAPEKAGAALAPELYSAHVDMHQRLLVLDAMGAAAELMSMPPRLLEGAAQDPARDPRVKPHQRLAAAAAKSVSAVQSQARVPEVRRKTEQETEAGDGGGDGAKQGALAQGKTRVWGVRSLARQGAAPKRTHRNRFPAVALQWFQALLDDCEAPRHGVDLFGRDSLLLGRLLATLGRFVVAAAPAPVTAQLASATIELLRTPQVAMHAQPFVRRAALYAAAQVVSALPPARLAGALLGGAGDVQDAALVERLEWLREWTTAVAESDSDEQCRMLAGSCRSLQAGLASQALEALESGAGDWEPGQSTGLLSAAATAASARSNVTISLPEGLTEMRLR